MPLPSFALLSEWLQGWCSTPQLSQAAAGAVGTSWPLCLTGWIHGMNSLCALLCCPACAVLAASLHASPQMRGSHSSCSAMAFPALPHKLCCALMLACSCHASSSPPAPFLGSVFPVRLLGYYIFCKFLFEHFVIVNKENETF